MRKLARTSDEFHKSWVNSPIFRLGLLAPLAYVSPRFIEALADGRPIAELTVTALAKSLPLAWAEQEGAYVRTRNFSRRQGRFGVFFRFPA